MSDRSSSARVVARTLQADGRHAWHSLLRNTIASSPFVPRVVRAILYRVAGYRFQTANIGERQIFNNGNVRLGRNTSVSRGCYFEGRGAVTIGAECMIGQEVAFITSNHDVQPGGTINRRPTHRPITVGTGTWLGARVTVLGGTEIGDGVIVTAGSVVSGVCTSGMVYSGVPARKIGRVKALAALAETDPTA
jgi:maltose O-acetyltransferase